MNTGECSVGAGTAHAVKSRVASRATAAPSAPVRVVAPVGVGRVQHHPTHAEALQCVGDAGWTGSDDILTGDPDADQACQHGLVERAEAVVGQPGGNAGGERAAMLGLRVLRARRRERGEAEH